MGAGVMFYRNGCGFLSRLVFAAVCFLVVDEAAAANLGAEKKVPLAPVAVPAGWTFEFMPYAWLPSVNGSTTLLGRTTHVDASFIDIASHAQIPKNLFGLMAHFEARNGKLSWFGDFTYLQVGASSGATRVREYAPELAVGIAAQLAVKMRQTIVELGGTYEVARWAGSAPNSWLAVDVLGGGRVWWQSLEADLDVAAAVVLPGLTFVNGRSASKSGSVDWVDPFIGLRARYQIAPGRQLMLRGDVGGFDVGSENSWQAIAAYSFDFKTTQSAIWSGVIGYKALYADYRKGAGIAAYEFDMLQHGPIFGVSARF